MPLTRDEQETIINFDPVDENAYLFTYSERVQHHMERKLGLTPTKTNSFGGKDYTFPKKWIRMPQKPKNLTDAQRKKIGERLSKIRKPTTKEVKVKFNKRAGDTTQQ